MGTFVSKVNWQLAERSGSGEDSPRLTFCKRLGMRKTMQFVWYVSRGICLKINFFLMHKCLEGYEHWITNSSSSSLCLHAVACKRLGPIFNIKNLGTCLQCTVAWHVSNKTLTCCLLAVLVIQLLFCQRFRQPHCFILVVQTFHHKSEPTTALLIFSVTNQLQNRLPACCL